MSETVQNPDATNVPTQAEIEAIVKEVQTAIDAFLSHPRHERYRSCSENKQAIGDYLEQHSLPYTPDTLHLAFTELSKAGKILLFAESKLPAELVETEKPREVAAENPVDLSSSLANQQKARRQVLDGPRDSSRDAFIRTAQSQRSPKIAGGRFHL